MSKLTTDYRLKVTQKGKKYHYEVTDKEGKILNSRTSTNPNFVAVMICQRKNGFVYCPNFFFSRFELVGKGDSRHELEFHIATATL